MEEDFRLFLQDACFQRGDGASNSHVVRTQYISRLERDGPERKEGTEPRDHHYLDHSLAWLCDTLVTHTCTYTHAHTRVCEATSNAHLHGHMDQYPERGSAKLLSKTTSILPIKHASSCSRGCLSPLEFSALSHHPRFKHWLR